MAAVLEFRNDSHRRKRMREGGEVPAPGGRECEIVIFPGVRIERPAGEPAADRREGTRD